MPTIVRRDHTRAALRWRPVAACALLALAAVPLAAQPRPHDVPLDLATLHPGRTVIDVPAGEMIAVHLVNRAPAGTYQYSSEQPGGPPPFFQHLEAVRVRHEPLHISPECDAYEQALVPVLTAVREADLPALLATYRKETAAHPCAHLEGSTGAMLGNKNLLTIGVSGDGDTASIGMGQFVHMLRRNVPMIYIIENNGVYGLTKGQFSATADLGSKAKSGVSNDLPAIDLCAMAIELGCNFVARSFAGDRRTGPASACGG